MNPFELCFETKDGTKIPFVKDMKPVPIAKVVSFKSDKLSFSANCILSPQFEEHIQHLLHKKREEKILDELLNIYDICLFDDLRNYLNSYLSEYQYLNPLF